jgi:predicted O-methyltransferase YrrM
LLSNDWFSSHVPFWLSAIEDYDLRDKHLKVLEIGSWEGLSSYFILSEISNAHLTCVDTWEGSEEHKDMDIIKNNELYEKFLTNIEPVKHVITPIRLPSIEAATKFSDDSLDFVFIDASHDYENVKNDILAWYPKVKYNGILAGHDTPWDGVQKAVTNFLNFTKTQLIINSELCWGIIKKY